MQVLICVLYFAKFQDCVVSEFEHTYDCPKRQNKRVSKKRVFLVTRGNYSHFVEWSGVGEINGVFEMLGVSVVGNIGCKWEHCSLNPPCPQYQCWCLVANAVY